MAKILIVDDEELIRKSIVEALSRREYELAEAANGSEALTIMQSWSPDLVLADINMTPINGYELVERIRHNPACITTRIVLITGQPDTDALRQGMNEGADDYLPKPFYVSELLKCVASQLSRQVSYRSAIQNALRKITSILPNELITPLGKILQTAHSISTNAESIENERLRQEAYDLENQAQKLQRTVENFLLFSQVQAYDHAPNRWNTKDDNSYSEETFENIARSEASLWNREDDLELILSNDYELIGPGSLEKVLREVLSNAFKFSSPGSRVTLTTNHQLETFGIQIENSGSGMTPQEVRSIGAFMRFGNENKQLQGTGLGLYLAKRLTEIHGGKFKIESEPKSFTRVLIEVPSNEAVLVK